MCIRDRSGERVLDACAAPGGKTAHLLELSDCRVTALDSDACLLYTSDAADDLLCVDLGGRRIIKKKTAVKDNQIDTH